MAGADPKTCEHVFIEKESFCCECCNKQFTTSYNLNRHRKGNCLENVCHKCNVRFHKREQLDDHVPHCTGVQPHRCELCGKSFQKRSNLARHRQTHTERCEKCRATFYKRIPLQYYSTSTDHPPPRCPHCDDTPKHGEDFNAHVNKHFELTLNKCELCGLGFEKKRQLVQHGRKVHRGMGRPATKSQKRYTCVVCLRIFRLHRDMKKHLQVHIEAGEKVYRCKVCNKGYSRKSTLTMHMFKHASKDKQPRCKVCSKTFSHPYCLRAHMRIHNNQRPFMCTMCSKSFRQHGHLLRHIASHAQSESTATVGVIKQLRICDICSMTFDDLHGLKVHLLTHNGTKYQCDLCGKCFLSTRSLKDHQNRHTGAKPYKCPICPETFALTGSLIKHKRTHPELKVKPPKLAKLKPVKQETPEIEFQPQMQPTVMYLESLPGPLAPMLQPSSIGIPSTVSIQNQLQPIHNPQPAAHPDQLPAADGSHLHFQLQSPVKALSNISGNNPGDNMPTYWHLQQSNFVQYHHPTSQDPIKAAPATMFLTSPSPVPAQPVSSGQGVIVNMVPVPSAPGENMVSSAAGQHMVSSVAGQHMVSSVAGQHMMSSAAGQHMVPISIPHSVSSTLPSQSI